MVDAKNALVLAIGTSNPPYYVLQEKCPDFYFEFTYSEHMVDLKEKYKRICEKTAIRKRHLHLTDKVLKENPSFVKYGEGSLDARHKILVEEVPKLGAEAATRALQEWGRPWSEITHLVFVTASGSMMPGADYALTKLLNLSHKVRRVMLYNLGCYGGGTALRVAKDLAENNAAARVLVVCSENTTLGFHGPSEDHMDMIVGQAIFSDGASSAVVGAGPKEGENGLFEIVSAHQMIVPGSDGALTAHIRQMGLFYSMSKRMTFLINDNIEDIMKDAFGEFGISDWNSLFYCVHPGGKGIIDGIAERLKLKEECMLSTRHVLSEYGNMSSACVIFILDQLRRRARDEGKPTTGDGKEYGCLIGIGPGLTVECLVLKSCPIVSFLFPS